MTARIRLDLPVPPSANAYWRVDQKTGHVFVSKVATEYKETIRKLVECAPLLGDVKWVGTWFRARAVGDTGANRLKVLEDALEGLCYLDDKQIAEYHWQRSDDEPTNPRIELDLVGDAFASPREVMLAREAKKQAAAKRKATRRANRAEGAWIREPKPSLTPPRR